MADQGVHSTRFQVFLFVLAEPSVLKGRNRNHIFVRIIKEHKESMRRNMARTQPGSRIADPGQSVFLIRIQKSQLCANKCLTYIKFILNEDLAVGQSLHSTIHGKKSRQKKYELFSGMCLVQIMGLFIRAILTPKMAFGFCHIKKSQFFAIWTKRKHENTKTF